MVGYWERFHRSPDEGFWACLGDLPPDMPRRPETFVSLCNLMLKLRGISRFSAILWSDSPQSNNRKDNPLWVTPFIPLERPNVKHTMVGLFKATTAYTSASADARAALATQLSGETRVRHWQTARKLCPDTRRLQLTTPPPQNHCVSRPNKGKNYSWANHPDNVNMGSHAA